MKLPLIGGDSGTGTLKSKWSSCCCVSMKADRTLLRAAEKSLFCAAIAFSSSLTPSSSFIRFFDAATTKFPFLALILLDFQMGILLILDPPIWASHSPTGFDRFTGFWCLKEISMRKKQKQQQKKKKRKRCRKREIEEGFFFPALTGKCLMRIDLIPFWNL